MIGKIIALDNDQQYIVSSESVYNGDQYVLLAHIDYQKSDLDDDMIVAKYSNDEVEFINDNSLIDLLLPSFNLN